MPSSNVSWPTPLQRLTPWYPGQFGVPGTDSERGLRMHSTGTVFYVDPNAIGVSDGRDGTNPDEPLATVAAALLKCQAYRGDVIAVMANNANPYADASEGYTTAISEEVTVGVPGVRIVGVCPSGSMGVVWTPASALGTCITINANDVLVEGFYFTAGVFGGCDGILAQYDGLATFGDYTTIRNCSFDDTVDMAIQLEYTWYCNVHDNIFVDCDDYGIYVDPAGSGISYCNIHHNLFQNCDVAMSLNGCDNSFIGHNVIYNANAQGAGVATDEGIDTTAGAGNTVYDNWFSCLLPVPANGDYDDLNTASATDAWINNHCMNGDAVTNPT